LFCFCSAAVVGGIPVGAGTSAFFAPAVENKSSMCAFGHEIDYPCG
jgi:hypothetical protein